MLPPLFVLLLLMSACRSPLGEVSDTSFKAELAVDLRSVEDRLTEAERPALDVLEDNLNALVTHNHELYRSGFVDEQLADAMEGYYGEAFQYRFTDIDSVEILNDSPHQIQITVLGRKLDTSTGADEAVKLFYAIRQDGEGQWKIWTID